MTHALELTRVARAEIRARLAFYNLQRPHQALGYRTPMASWRHRRSRRYGRGHDASLGQR
ncbi:MAG: integrase core domain-containing protein [Acetobacteraceae bacterium]